MTADYEERVRRQIESEIANLKRRAQSAEGLPDDLSLPQELARREDRLAAIKQAQAERESQAAGGLERMRKSMKQLRSAPRKLSFALPDESSGGGGPRTITTTSRGRNARCSRATGC